MSELNDDMDELFRRAAENYPLKTDSSNWSKVNNALQAADGNVSVDINEAKKKNYRKLLWLALLLFVPWVCYKYNEIPNNTINESTSKNISTKENQLKKATAEDGNNINKVPEENPSNTTVPDIKKTASKNVANASNTVIDSRQNNNGNKSGIVTKERNRLKISGDNNKELSSSIINLDKAAEYKSVENNKEDAVAQKNTSASTTIQKDIVNQSANVISKDSIQQRKNLTQADSLLSNKSNAVTSINKKTDKKKKTARVYVGAFTGADISTVKFQSVNNAGFSIAGLLGYQLNKKIAIETGVLWDKKFYYSDGKYFNTSKIYLPPNSVIDNVDGNCSMIELPVNVKYNFKSSGKTTWFSLIGLSSYFMKTENYDYTLNTSGVYAERYRTYTNSSTNWLSVMNLSIGYSHVLGKRKKANLRIEPYLKIPLKGVGIGNMPITSSGINIGITKTIF